jgi:hypothetical protein
MQTTRPDSPSGRSIQPADEENDFEGDNLRPIPYSLSSAPPFTKSSATAQKKSPGNTPNSTPKRTTKKLLDPSEASVNRAITEYLQIFKEDTKGPRHNYVYETVMTEGGPILYKIGMSINPKQRRRAIESDCQFSKITEVDTAIENHPSATAMMTEQLIQMELRSFLREGPCTSVCKTDHQEYFHVSKDIALQAHKRWVTFCRTEPWGPDGKLLPYWEDRLLKKQKLEDNCGYSGLAASWEEFTRPPQYYKEFWDAQVVFKRIVTKWASWIACAHAADSAWSRWPSPYPATWFGFLAATVIWLFVHSLSSDNALFLNATQARRMVASRVVDKKRPEGPVETTPDDTPVWPADDMVDGTPEAESDGQKEVAERSPVMEDIWDDESDTPALDPEDEECADGSGIALLDEFERPEEQSSGDEMDWIKDNEVDRGKSDEMDLSKGDEDLGVEQLLGSMNLGGRVGFEREGFGAGGVRVGSTSVPVAA